jgi:hypothetical protein
MKRQKAGGERGGNYIVRACINMQIIASARARRHHYVRVKLAAAAAIRE